METTTKKNDKIPNDRKGRLKKRQNQGQTKRKHHSTVPIKQKAIEKIGYTDERKIK